MRVSEINIYPIKSLKGIGVDSAVVEARGLQYDRRWMLTTPDGMFFTQREFPKMATISVAVTGDGLQVTGNGSGQMIIPFQPDMGERREVTVWKSTCEGLFYGGAVNEWFSDAIGTKCQLVYMPDDSRRSVNPLFDKGDDIVSFADGYPLMLLGEGSLEDLNARIAGAGAHAGRLPAFRPLQMNRFRPNLVVSGSDPFSEDNWARIRIGEAVFRSTKPCERCVITTVDQSKGELDGNEPLKTFSTFRMAKHVMPGRYESLGVGANAVLFGQNLIAETVGVVIRVGDKLEVLSELA
jgi:uncharacterized protein YcbX